MTALPTSSPDAPADPARAAYRGAAARWERDASAAYGPMARHLVARSPIDLAGALALDAGAGTGAASVALLAAGARVVAVDLEASMLALDRDRRPPSVAGNVTALPFATAMFDAAIAAFVLNHVGDVAAGLHELARVTTRGGAVLASTFSNRRAVTKSAFDDVAAAYGWTPPAWYEAIRVRQSAIGTTGSFVDAARRAGIRDVTVVEQQLDIHVDDPATIVRYRLGMPQYADFLDRLGEDRLGEFVGEATAVMAAEGPFRPEIIDLIARVT